MNKYFKYDEIVEKILNNPLDYEWELQGFGMLRTYIDKDTRMQIWLNSFIIQDVTDIHTIRGILQVIFIKVEFQILFLKKILGILILLKLFTINVISLLEKTLMSKVKKK